MGKIFRMKFGSVKCLATYGFDVINVVYKSDITLRYFVSSRYEMPFGFNALKGTGRKYSKLIQSI